MVKQIAFNQLEFSILGRLQNMELCDMKSSSQINISLYQLQLIKYWLFCLSNTAGILNKIHPLNNTHLLLDFVPSLQ